jgi:hypothetical protein
MLSFALLVYLVVNQPTGTGALYLILPVLLVALVHVRYGSAALIAAFRTGRHRRNSWIYGYFFGLAGALLTVSGLFQGVHEMVQAQLDQLTQPRQTSSDPAPRPGPSAGDAAQSGSGATAPEVASPG